MQANMPIVYVGSSRIRFNSVASAYISRHEYVNIIETNDYIVFRPCKPNDSGRNKRKVTSDGHKDNRAVSTDKFRNRIFCQKHFKLYMYKDGYAIKKMHPLQIMECA